MQGSASDKENLEISKDFREKLNVNVSDEIKTAKQEEGGYEEEFSFAWTNPDGSPIAADDIFQNEKIRTIFPIFDQSLLYCDGDGDTDGNLKNDWQSSLRPPLRKLVIEDRPNFETTDMTAEEEASGPFSKWSSRNTTVKEASLEPCKKRKSTGFSKLWRFRGLVFGSNSDGKDAFIVLNNNKCESEKPDKPSTSGKTTTTNKKTSKGRQKGGNVLKVTEDNKKVKAETVSSMYEKHYLKNRVTREGDKRMSYSPYRQDLVSFFANVNGLSRSVHPF